MIRMLGWVRREERGQDLDPRHRGIATRLKRPDLRIVVVRERQRKAHLMSVAHAMGAGRQQGIGQGGIGRGREAPGERLTERGDRLRDGDTGQADDLVRPGHALARGGGECESFHVAECALAGRKRPEIRRASAHSARR